MAKYQLKTLKGKDQDLILQEIYKSNYFFSANFEQLAKHFLGYFIDGEIFQMPFTEIKDHLNKQAPDSSILPKDENGLYTFLCKTYMDLERVPAEVMLEYCKTALKDIRTIEDRISDYDSRIDAINKKESKLKTEEDSYEIKILNYYKKANLSAHQEIIDFLKFKLEEYSIFNSTGRPWMTGILYGGIPYSFRAVSELLKPESLSDLVNKFNDLVIDDKLQLEVLYNKKDQTDFYKEAAKYVTDKRIIEKIEDLVAGNHRLNMRQRVFQEAFEAYRVGSKYLFCSVIALQIEGLFADYCIELGIEESSIRGGSISDKVRLATQIDNRYKYFEYYAFRFPLIRNSIAHGNLISRNVDQLANYLLLDLFDICISLTSYALPVNKVVSVLRLWDKDRKNNDLILKYCLFRNTLVPSFYKLDSILADIKDSINEPSFWNDISKMVLEGYEMLNKGILKIALDLKKAKINEPWCDKLIKLLKGVTTDNFDESQFLQELLMVDPE